MKFNQLIKLFAIFFLLAAFLTISHICVNLVNLISNVETTIYL